MIASWKEIGFLIVRRAGNQTLISPSKEQRQDSHKGYKPSQEPIWQCPFNANNVKAFPDRAASANSLLPFLKHSQLKRSLLDPRKPISFGLFWKLNVLSGVVNLNFSDKERCGNKAPTLYSAIQEHCSARCKPRVLISPGTGGEQFSIWAPPDCPACQTLPDLPSLPCKHLLSQQSVAREEQSIASDREIKSFCLTLPRIRLN